jgi:DNA polymerase III sliding clamp (beta) subunit (PCNA family)
MDFFIETAELQKIIKLLGVVTKSNMQDVSGRVLIEAGKNNEVLFISNNNSTAVSAVSRKSKVNIPGEISILFDKIKSFITSFQPWNGEYGAKEFHFVFNENNVTILVDNVYESGKKSKGKLKLDYFDPFSIKKPESFGKADFILNSNIFKTAVNKIIYATNPNENKRYIHGMNLRFDENSIYFAGTDGISLSEYKVNNVSELKTGNFILRHDFVTRLKTALGEETQIFFEIKDGKIKAKFEDVCFYGKLNIGHTYPEYQHKFDEFKNAIVIDKEVLLGNLKPFVDVLDDDDNSRITFFLKNKEVIFYNDNASFSVDYDVDYKGEFIIDLNGKRFIQTIEAIKDDVVLIKFIDENSHIVFDSENFKNQTALLTHIKRR